MAITLRSDVNRPLTFAEVDANFNEIDTNTVKKTGDETIAGTKTFSNSIVGNLTGNVTGNVIGNVTGNVTGNSSTANSLATSRNISLSGDVTGTVSFNGTQNVTMTTSLTEGFVSGMIMMWSGTSANVPTGWALCDGNNGTPNLVNKFIRGATTSGGTGGYADATLVSHSHSFSGTTSSNGEHNHTGYSNLNLNYSNGGGRPNDAPNGYATSGRQWQTLYGGSHSHSFSGTTNSTGDSATNKNLPPYYELCYIVKV